VAFAIQTGQTVLFTGDSITDCGRRAEHHPLGAGYVRMAADLINARYPANGCRFINTGIGGNCVRDLLDRWSDDVVRFQPDWLSVMIGINDLHRHLGGGPDAYGPDVFAQLYERILIRAAGETQARLVLLTPFYMSTDRPGDAHGWRGRVMQAISAYIEIVRHMADTYNALLVDTHAVFQQQLQYHRADEFGDEPVHPNTTGHLLLAHEWLRALDW
jgi:acyl-CoA thioesterase-1